MFFYFEEIEHDLWYVLVLRIKGNNLIQDELIYRGSLFGI